MEFFVNFGDWLFVKVNSKFIFILLWCGFGDIFDIVMLIYDFIEFILEIMGR